MAPSAHSADTAYVPDISKRASDLIRSDSRQVEIQETRREIPEEPLAELAESSARRQASNRKS